MRRIRRALVWIFAVVVLFQYGLATAGIITFQRNISDYQKINSISGTITKIIKKEEYQRIIIEQADVYAGSGCYGKTGVVVNYYGDERFIKGDVIQFIGTLEIINGPENPGAFDMHMYYVAQNVFYQVNADEIRLIKKCENDYYRIIFAIKDKLKKSYEQIADEKDAGVCISMVLGDKSMLSEELNSLFQDNGIAHILAISGLHISMIGMTFYSMLRRCGIGFFISAGVSAFLMISYGIMTGNSVSTIRAVVMFIMTIYAQVVGRTYDSISALCLSAIIIMLKYPYCIYNSGFLLSFGAVLGIVFINPFLKKIVSIKNQFLEGLFASISVTLATLPIIMNTFYEIPVYSVLLNLIVVPLMTLLMMSAVLAGMAGLICIPFGIFLMGPASFIIDAYEFICTFILKLPFASYITGAPSLIQIIIYYMIMTVILIVTCFLKRFYKITGMLMIASVGILFYRNINNLEIVMLSVGQGDCMYISAQGYDILIDGGSTSNSSIGKYTILPFLKYKGVHKLEYVVLTHPDRDHYSGLVELMEDGTIEIDNFLMADIQKPDEKYLELFEMADICTNNAGVISAGEILIDDKLKIKCIHPEKDYVYSSANDYSITFHVRYGEFDMITTGDLEAAGEKNILANNMAGNVEVLKCGHHGSSTSTTREWLEVLAPDIALISCGENNSYGHPHEGTIKKLQDVGSKIYISYKTGAVIIHTNGRKAEITTYLNGYFQ